MGARADPLPDDVREWVGREASLLAEAYHFDYNEDHADADYDGTKHEVLTGPDWQWYGKGSERTVAYLGRTYGGKPIYQDFRGVVVKFNPWLRSMAPDAEKTVSTVSEAGNLHEIAVWKWASDHGDRDLFASLLDYSEYGDWVAQEYHIPVYRYSEPVFANATIDYIRDNKAESQYCDILYDEATDRGYDPHTKDGNVGLDTDTGLPVCLDFGAHVDIDGVPGRGLTDYVLTLPGDDGK